MFVLAQQPIKTVRIKADTAYFLKLLPGTAAVAKFLYIDENGKVGYLTGSFAVDSSNIWTSRDDKIYPTYIDRKVGIGTTNPETNLAIGGSFSSEPIYLDSAMISTSGITTLMENIVYNDFRSAMYDWDLDYPQIGRGVPGQVITIQSIGTGKLYIYNHPEGSSPSIEPDVFIMSNYDNITFRYINDTWVEIARTDYE